MLQTVTKFNLISLSDGFQLPLLYISLSCIVEYFAINMHVFPDSFFILILFLSGLSKHKPGYVTQAGL